MSSHEHVLRYHWPPNMWSCRICRTLWTDERVQAKPRLRILAKGRA